MAPDHQEVRLEIHGEHDDVAHGVPGDEVRDEFYALLLGKLLGPPYDGTVEASGYALFVADLADGFRKI